MDSIYCAIEKDQIMKQTPDTACNR